MVAHYTSDKKVNGIICDRCNKVVVDKFQYFSVKFDLIEVDRSVGKHAVIRDDKRVMDLDLCVECVERERKLVMKRIREREKPKQGPKEGNSEWETKT